ncbi:MAG: S8 family serine peptidase [Candidatus Cloacimonetes bacterium]|nr:S8 family serine peptidase [Candidatus Cloacimonadota bacterium]
MFKKTKFIVLCLLVVIVTTMEMNGYENEIFYPGIVTINLSVDLIGNTRGEINITRSNGLIVTPFEWFNELAEEFQIISLERMFVVKNQTWSRNGRYPMNTFRLQIEDPSRTDELIEILSDKEYVMFAEKEAINRMFEHIPHHYASQNSTNYIPNDPDISEQWWLEKVQAFNAWAIQTGDPDIVIGIVDSGVKWNHIDLMANMWVNQSEMEEMEIIWEAGEITGSYGSSGIQDQGGAIYWGNVLGWDFYSTGSGGQDNNPFQTGNGSDHGTHVAGIAAGVGDNGAGMAGLAYSSSILATKHSPYGSFSNSIFNAYHGIYYMVDAGANIINCSWGGGGSASIANDAVAYAKAHNVLVVAAAGNGNQNIFTSPVYPASAVGILTVAATDINDMRSIYSGGQASNFGFNVDVSAPGSNIYSTSFTANGNDSWRQAGGTSMASPMVAGLAALVWSQNPNLTVDEVINYIREGTDPIDHLNPGYAGRLGTGRINAFKTLQMVRPLEYDLAAASLIGLIGAPLNTVSIFTVNVRNLGENPAFGYYIHLLEVGNDAPLVTVPGVTLEHLESAHISLEWMPTVLGDYEIYALLEWDIDERERNNKTNILEVRVIPEGTAEAYIGNKNSNEALNYSFVNYNTRDSITQTIFYEHELAKGLIYQMTVLFTGSPTLVNQGNEVEIYLTTTEKSFFSHQTDWVAYEQFTLVFSGDLEVFSEGINEVEIQFDTPFNYQGGNLVLMAIKDGNILFGAGNVFQYSNISDINRNIWWRSNQAGSPNLDPFPNATGLLTGVTNTRFGIYTFVIEPPQSFEAKGYNEKIYLNWQEPFTQIFGTLANYRIYRNGILLNETTTLEFIDENVEIGLEYEYWVTAVYSSPNVESDPSNKVSANIENILAPKNLVAQVVNIDTVILVWEMDSAIHDTNANLEMSQERLNSRQNQEIKKRNPIGFNVYRNENLVSATVVTETTFTENNVPVGTHIYSVEAVYQTGISTPISVEIEIDDSSDNDENLPVLKTELIGNFPNPFNPETTIVFTLALDTNVNIDIFNIRGQKILNLIDSKLKSGKHSIVWNGRDEKGVELGSGMYLYVFKTDEFSQIKRMLLLK